MDDQSVVFHKLPADTQTDWLEQIPGVNKVDFKRMTSAIRSGEYTLWQITGEGPDGIAVTYPEDGFLFIYYLHATGLFGKLTRDDLFNVSRAEKCLEGLRAAATKGGMVVLLRKLGFEITGYDNGVTDLELEDNGRRRN